MDTLSNVLRFFGHSKHLSRALRRRFPRRRPPAGRPAAAACAPVPPRRGWARLAPLLPRGPPRRPACQAWASRATTALSSGWARALKETCGSR
jgi:hypothetical protein